MDLVALPPDLVRWVARNGEDNDCAVAAISLATGETYEQILAIAASIQPAVLKMGLLLSDVKKVLDTLGIAWKVRRKHYNIEKDTGLLWVEPTDRRKRDAHLVYLWAGRIIEPAHTSRSLWLDPEAYLKVQESRAVYLITLSHEESPNAENRPDPEFDASR